MMDGGESGKREGMARAWRGADPEWRRIALMCALEVAKRKPYFTTDEIEEWRRTYYPNHTTHEQRAWGPVMKEAAKLEYCTILTSYFVKSKYAPCHTRHKQMWWSLIYRGPDRPHRPRRRRPLDPRQFDLFATL
jgi:hypothetical protein